MTCCFYATPQFFVLFRKQREGKLQRLENSNVFIYRERFAEL